MGALLAGGEVLLTSGLGLHGRSDAQLVAYVDQLADAGCVALALELGRSFLRVPDVMIEAARRRDLVLLAITVVVPFERYIEDFHETVVQRRLAAGTDHHLFTRFAELLISGVDLVGLLDDIARVAGGRAEVLDPDGAPVERSRIDTHPIVTGSTTAPIPDRRGTRGTLAVMVAEDARVRAVADQGALAVALALAQQSGLGPRSSTEQAVLADLYTDSIVSAQDAVRRLRAVGLPVDEHHRSLVMALGVPADHAPADVLAAVRQITELPGRAVGVLSGDVVAIVQVPVAWETAQVRERMRVAAATVTGALGADAEVLLAVVGPSDGPSDGPGERRADGPAHGPGHLGAQVREARALLRLARRYGQPSGVVLAQDLGLQTLLSDGTSASALTAFVAAQIGPLIESDRSRSAQLVRTLDAYLDNDLSKAATAQVLGIRRQSLYRRLARIEGLLGVRLDDHQARTRLAVALTAWRLHTGLDPQALF